MSNCQLRIVQVRDGTAVHECVQGGWHFIRRHKLSCCACAKSGLRHLLRNVCCTSGVSSKVFRLEVASFANFVDNTACNAITSMQGCFAHCLSTVQEPLERLLGHDGAQGGPSAQGAPSTGSMDPDSRP